MIVWKWLNSFVNSLKIKHCTWTWSAQNSLRALWTETKLCHINFLNCAWIPFRFTHWRWTFSHDYKKKKSEGKDLFYYRLVKILEVATTAALFSLEKNLYECMKHQQWLSHNAYNMVSAGSVTFSLYILLKQSSFCQHKAKSMTNELLYSHP